jgi:Family of unknown function (DUF6114)
MSGTLSRKKPTTAFLLSFTGGMLILAGGVSMVVVEVLLATGAPLFLHNIADAGLVAIQKSGFEGGFPYAVAVITGVTSGFAVLYAAIMTWERPSKARDWGFVTIAFSFVSLVGIGGFGIGALLGTLGGAVTITWAESRSRAYRRPWWRKKAKVADTEARGNSAPVIAISRPEAQAQDWVQGQWVDLASGSGRRKGPVD